MLLVIERRPAPPWQLSPLVGVGRPPTFRCTVGFLGAPFPQSELRQINLSLTGLHHLDNKAIGRQAIGRRGSTGSSGRSARSSARRRALRFAFAPRDSTDHFRSHTPTRLARRAVVPIAGISDHEIAVVMAPRLVVAQPRFQPRRIGEANPRGRPSAWQVEERGRLAIGCGPLPVTVGI